MNPVPKVVRLRDPKAIKAARKPFCENCGGPAYGEPHHIIPRSCGGADHRLNLVQLCFKEHYGAVATGELKPEQLFAIIAKREGMAVEDVIREVNRMRGKA